MALMVDTGEKKTIKVASLVLLAFRGPRPSGLQARHANGIRTDDRLSNLNYCTPSQNVRDQVRHKTHNSASKTHCPMGHPYDGDNTLVEGKGQGRKCRACKRERAGVRARAAVAMRKVAKLIDAETRPVIEVKRIRELIPPELLRSDEPDSDDLPTGEPR